jgi:hypothetical protein
MASTVTLSDMIERARVRADMNNSEFLTTAMWTDFINQSARELYDLLVATDQDYYTIDYSLVVDGTTNEYNLPSDFYKLKGVDYKVDGDDRWQPMPRYNFMDRNRWNQVSNLQLWYRDIRGKIRFSPKPAAQTMRIWYIPCLAPLVNGTDTFDGINGWEDYVEVRAAIFALVKEESDPSALMLILTALKERIQAMAASRDQGQSEQVTDVNRLNSWIGWNGDFWR